MRLRYQNIVLSKMNMIMKHYLYRLLAFYVDIFMCWIISITTIFMIEAIGKIFDLSPILISQSMGAVFFLTIYFYFVAYQTRYSMTIGKRLFRLKVVTISGKRLGIGMMALRFTLLILPPFCLLICLAIFDLDNHRGFHDKATGTKVVFW